MTQNRPRHSGSFSSSGLDTAPPSCCCLPALWSWCETPLFHQPSFHFLNPFWPLTALSSSSGGTCLQAHLTSGDSLAYWAQSISSFPHSQIKDGNLPECKSLMPAQFLKDLVLEAEGVSFGPIHPNNSPLPPHGETENRERATLCHLIHHAAAGALTCRCNWSCRTPASSSRWVSPSPRRSTGHDGLPPPLGAGDVSAGTEEHPIAVLGRDLVKELPEGLVALAPGCRRSLDMLVVHGVM